MSDAIRLAKRIAELRDCSRNEAEQLIAGGWVSVDGVVVEDPAARVTPCQQIDVAPSARPGAIEPVTILLHKPAGIVIDEAGNLITAANRWTGDRREIGFLRQHLRKLAATDRLEDSASGLLVFTQDFRIARKLIDDAAKVEHEVVVEVQGTIIENGLQLLRHGLRFNKRELPPIKVSWQSETRLRFALKSPPRGLIGHMCAQVGLQVVGMKRIRIGRLPLAALPAGQWRYLLGYERF